MSERHNHLPKLQLFRAPPDSILVGFWQPIKRVCARFPHNLRIQRIPSSWENHIPSQPNNTLNTDLLGSMRFPERNHIAPSYALALLLFLLLDKRAAVLVLYLGRAFAHRSYDDPVLSAGFVHRWRQCGGHGRAADHIYADEVVANEGYGAETSHYVGAPC